MIYRFLAQEERRTIVNINRDFDLTNPPKAVWTKDWEWIYDFPDIKRNLALSIKSAIFRLSLWLIKFLGGKVKSAQPEYAYSVNYVDIDTERIQEAIMRKLSESQMNRLGRDELMIIVGAREFHELQRLNDNFTFMLDLRYGERHGERSNIYMLGVPVVVLVDFVGLAIVPDFKGDRIKRLISRY